MKWFLHQSPLRQLPPGDGVGSERPAPVLVLNPGKLSGESQSEQASVVLKIKGPLTLEYVEGGTDFATFF